MMKKMSKISLMFLMILMLIFGSVSSAQALWISGGRYVFATYVPQIEEMRALWVATVGNLDIPKLQGTDEKSVNDWKAAYVKILDTVEEKNLNTVIFQIRPCNDAFYPSKYNPWSEFLTSNSEGPGFDPLEWMIEVTHARGLEYHAWLNPYRTSTSALDFSITQTESGTNINKVYDYNETELNQYKETYFQRVKSRYSQTYNNPIFQTGTNLYNDVVLGTEGKFVLNPASSNVLKHLDNTITEIVDNYDIDGIHFDDYFYPDDCSYGGTQDNLRGYTYSSEPYKDMRDYQAYLNSGGSLSLYNWRRSNVDTLIKNLSDIIRSKNQTKDVKCAFGISPCARWAPALTIGCTDRGAEGGMSGGCNNYYSYSDLYADTRKWALEEWIDYIVPQCYTNLDSGYGDIVEWWSNTLANSKTKLYIGQGIYQVPTWGDTLEMLNQVRYNQTEGYDVEGYFFYRYTSLLSGRSMNAMNGLTSSVWRRNTLTPVYDYYTYKSTVSATPEIENIVENKDGTLTINFKEVEDAKAYVLKEYEENEIINLHDGKYVQLVQKNHHQLQFTKTEGKKYILAPIAQNNVVQEQYEVVDFEKIVVNNVPKISVDNLPSSINLSTNLDVTVQIEDTDNDSFEYVVLLLEGSEENSREIARGSVEGYQFTFSWRSYAVEQDDLSFKITVSDGTDIGEYITSTFKIAKPVVNTFQITYNLDGGQNPNNAPTTYQEGVGIVTLPTPTKDGYTFIGWSIGDNDNIVNSLDSTQTGDVTLTAHWEKNKGCAGCKKSSTEYVINALACFSMAIIILRRKKN